MDHDAQMESMIIVDEGEMLCPYQDSRHHLSIGVGHNLDADPHLRRELHGRCISHGEAMALMRSDLDRAEALLDRALPWWRSLSENRRRALLNMAFNLNEKLLTFRRALELLHRGQYREAAEAFLRSRWARQVGDRARRVANLIRRG